MVIQNGQNIQAQASIGASFQLSVGPFQHAQPQMTAPTAQLGFGFGHQSMMNASTQMSQGWSSYMASLPPQTFGLNGQAQYAQMGQMGQMGQMFQMMQVLMQALSAQFQGGPQMPSQAQQAPAIGQHQNSNSYYQPKAQHPAQCECHYQPKAAHKPEYKKPAPKPQPKPQPKPVPQPQDHVFEGGDGGGDGGDGGGTPVVLDLNNDGKFDVTGKNGKKVDFDLFGDGTKLKTEWLKEGTRDGLLVADFNGDGKIDSGRELMRNTGVNGEQGKYATGWEKVRELFDGNNDGKVNGEELGGLQVWVDSNGDGKTDAGELQSVASHGVSEIDIPPSGEMVSSFVKDGNKQLAEDILFDYTLV